MVKKKKKQYEFEPERDMFVSELLCDRCKHKNDCDIGEDCSDTCDAYRALEKWVP